MARIARIVVPGYAHHITQRGNHREEIFFSDEDYRHYLSLMAEWCSRLRVAIWVYCVMPNHTHLIAVPPAEDKETAPTGNAWSKRAMETQEQ